MSKLSKAQREKIIFDLIEFNLGLAQNDTEWNDGFIYDALRYGCKGFEEMTDDELLEEQQRSVYAN